MREAVANAIKHGNRQDPDKQVEVEVEFRRRTRWRSGSTTRARASTRTRSRDPLAPENLFRASGRGIFYMRKFMDEVELRLRPVGRDDVLRCASG